MWRISYPSVCVALAVPLKPRLEIELGEESNKVAMQPKERQASLYIGCLSHNLAQAFCLINPPQSRTIHQPRPSCRYCP